MERPFQHDGIVILVLLYNDLCNMLCTMDSCHPKQHIILLSHTSTSYTEKALLNDTREHSHPVRPTSL